MYASLLNYPGALFGDFERLRRELDDVFESAGMPANIRSVAPGAFPAINVGNTPEALEIYAFAPGIDAAKLEVTVDRGVLTIAGERPSDLPSRDARSGGNGNGNENTPSVFSRERLSGRHPRRLARAGPVPACRPRLIWDLLAQCRRSQLRGIGVRAVIIEAWRRARPRSSSHASEACQSSTVPGTR